MSGLDSIKNIHVTVNATDGGTANLKEAIALASAGASASVKESSGQKVKPAPSILTPLIESKLKDLYAQRDKLNEEACRLADPKANRMFTAKSRAEALSEVAAKLVDINTTLDKLHHLVDMVIDLQAVFTNYDIGIITENLNIIKTRLPPHLQTELAENFYFIEKQIESGKLNALRSLDVK